MSDDTVLRHQLRYRHAPLVGRGQQQPLACFSARLLQVVATLAHIPARVDDHPAIHAVSALKLHRRGATGIGFPRARHLQRPLRRLLFEVAIGRGILGPHLFPVTLQFLSHHHRIGGEHAGSEFGLADADGHCVIGRDRNPGIDLGNGRFAVPGLGRDGRTRRLCAWRHPKPKDHCAANRSGRGQELASIHLCSVLGDCLSFSLFRFLLTHDVLLRTRRVIKLVWFLEGTPVFYHLAPTASRRTRSSEVWCPGCQISPEILDTKLRRS